MKTGQKSLKAQYRARCVRILAVLKPRRVLFLSAEFYENGQKINICKSGRTFNEARERLIEDGADEKELTEAIKTWKYLQ